MATLIRVSPVELTLTALHLLPWPALTLLLAGGWRWPEGWIFAGWFPAVRLLPLVW